MEEKERYEKVNNGYCCIVVDYKIEKGLGVDDICNLLNQQDKRIKELEKENQQLKQSQKQLAMEELKKLSKHFVYSGDEIVSDYDLDCDPSELKEEIERMVKELKGEDNANQTKIK